MGSIAYQITILTIVHSSVNSDVDQRKRQSSAPLAFVRGIHRRPVISLHKWPVTRKMFPFVRMSMCTRHEPSAQQNYYKSNFMSLVISLNTIHKHKGPGDPELRIE